MQWFSTHDKQPEYNQRCLCKLTNNNLYSVLVYIPMLGTTDKAWYNELSAMYYNLDFVESWYPFANIINKEKLDMTKENTSLSFEYFLEKIKYADEQKRKELVSLVRKIWDYLFIDDIYCSDFNSNKFELKEHGKEDPDVMEFLHFALKELYKTI